MAPHHSTGNSALSTPVCTRSSTPDNRSRTLENNCQVTHYETNFLETHADILGFASPTAHNRPNGIQIGQISRVSRIEIVLTETAPCSKHRPRDRDRLFSLDLFEESIAIVFTDGSPTIIRDRTKLPASPRSWFPAYDWQSFCITLLLCSHI